MERKRIIKLFAVTALCFFMIVSGAVLLTKAVSRSKLTGLHKALETGDVEAAGKLLDGIEQTEANAELFLQYRYICADKLLQEGRYAEASDEFADLGTFQDSEDKKCVCIYKQAEERAATADYEAAAELFNSIVWYSDAEARASESIYSLAEAERERGMTAEAFLLYASLGEYRDSEQKAEKLAVEISGVTDIEKAKQAVFGLSEESIRQMEKIADYRNALPDSVIAVGFYHTVGLGTNGIPMACGSNEYGQCDVGDWNEIVAVAAGAYHTLGLRKDGTVAAAGRDTENQCDVSTWTDIVAITAADYASFGLKADGTVVYSGLNDYSALKAWRNVKRISGGSYAIAGVKTDGTALLSNRTAGSDEYSELLDIAINTAVGVGLKADGTVVCSSPMLDLTNWNNIVRVSASGTAIMGIDSEGYVHSCFVGKARKLDTSFLDDVIALSAGGTHYVFVKSDGSVIALGDNSCGQCECQDWKIG